MMHESLKLYSLKSFFNHAKARHLSEKQKESLLEIGRILPFRVNNYVLENLINWEDIPNDPIFRMTFLQEGMVDGSQRTALEQREILNPHPSRQVEENIPNYNGKMVEGIQHKYQDTVLLFPKEGQQCHAYCTFCFRWAQFVDAGVPQFRTSQDKEWLSYIKNNESIKDVILTGGDPMFMSGKYLSQYLVELSNIEHIETIRIGSKALTYWPFKFVSDKDAKLILETFELVAKKKTLLFMAHISHPNEMNSDIFLKAQSNIQSAGASIKTQAPILNNINATPQVWGQMWSKQIKLGMIPYYMFIARPTGPKDYFAVDLRKALEIYLEARKVVDDPLAFLKGPVMSATQGKIQVMKAAEDLAFKRTIFDLKVVRARDVLNLERELQVSSSGPVYWIDDLLAMNSSDRDLLI